MRDVDIIVAKSGKKVLCLKKRYTETRHILIDKNMGYKISELLDDNYSITIARTAKAADYPNINPLPYDITIGDGGLSVGVLQPSKNACS